MPVMVILLLVLSWPFLEIATFIAIGREVGIFATIGLTLLTSAIGAFLLRVQGIAVLERVQAELQMRQVPTAALGQGALISVAGFMLLVPGFLSDLIGLLLFLPQVRTVVLRVLGRNMSMFVMTSSSRQSSTVIDLDRDEWERSQTRATGVKPIQGPIHGSNDDLDLPAPKP